LSGIVGIFHRSGASIDRVLLQSLVDFLAFRGPDRRECWMDGAIGLGHAMLRTTREPVGASQPASIDKRFWIVADARLDGRTELIEELRRSGRKPGSDAPDSELILNAFAAWGGACVDHLRGDFSFAVWDARDKQLVCARDHFGIKPLYYAALGDLFVFSNTLGAVRLHPDVSSELNDAAIGDFLLFGLNYDNATTSFRDIQRLPPAHALTLSSSGLRIRRYWTPPTNGPIRYTKPEAYVENFQSLFESAVADRLPPERAGILLSGGLDSSSVAAMAKELSVKSSPAIEIRGYTQVYESLIPDREGEYAREVGLFLRIPVKLMPMDDAELFGRWEDPEWSLPEPVDDPFLANILDCYRNISMDCRVLLSGEGSDNLMDFQMWPYARDLQRKGEWQRLFTETANYLWIRPFPWRGLRSKVLRFAGKDPDRPVFPPWLAPKFARQMDLAARWKEHSELPKSWMRHPILPRAHASLSLPQWTHIFEQEDAGVTHCAVETRYPFLDLRMVNYLLALPPFPWYFEKMLLREAMRGRIPERVRTRPKTPLESDAVCAHIRRSGTGRLKEIPTSPDLDRYIERSALVPPHDKMSGEEISASLRPHCLNIWLQSARRVRYNIHAEAGNG